MKPLDMRPATREAFAWAVVVVGTDPSGGRTHLFKGRNSEARARAFYNAARLTQNCHLFRHVEGSGL